MARGEASLVRPMAGWREEERGGYQRLLRKFVACLSIAGLLVAVAFYSSGSTSGRKELSQMYTELKFGDASFHAAGVLPQQREGSVRGKIAPHFVAPPGPIGEIGLAGKSTKLAQVPNGAAVLRFGDSSFHESKAFRTREGSVRGNIKPDFKVPLGDLGEIGLSEKPMRRQTSTASLAFGDASFHASKASQSKEGSVRGGVKPDFKPPLGDLGEEGLAQAPKTPIQKHGAVLAFGDSEFHSGPQASAREGSVRAGKTPDFLPPLGDLGEVGLKHSKVQTLVVRPKVAAASEKSSALAFGDSEFHSSKPSAGREGSIRNGVAPDFKPPIGDLGETGLKPTQHAQTLAASKKEVQPHKMTDVSARQDMNKFYNEQYTRLKQQQAASEKQALLTSQAAKSAIDRYYDTLNSQAVAEHKNILQSANRNAAQSQHSMLSYFDALQSHDNALHTAAMQRKAAANARIEKKAERETSASQSKEDTARMQVLSEKKIKPEITYGNDPGNKHGFHAVQVTKDAKIRKELAAARAIARKDMDDCSSGFC
ncbi:hypothetical protein GUITHDRAFT_163045 [Guillardia theta CCMP2712]|uniref:Uncharacterized protein n=1 Tax=Guillardia theta (strain CCMP2712) TaxID=905079 RepID=L1JE09_GUITC|nr:hypothetical protein GUITHDRAFT_163045 [Guillardia theta CCMP2712]EKX46325.1 hypothetical protein GUITHDRAFT_163045 [Guillardia theta CCMP2712]|eukprot:XP_005833305.1 hypothetical protein GUITHDRAFT_163045 [Guillardia theta CCMP2712]